MIPRLHHSDPLIEGAGARLGDSQAHYLRNVLRRTTGAPLRLFNERDGEFEATLEEIDKKRAVAVVGRRKRAPEAAPDIVLLIAPTKRAAFELVIQKGVELGAARFVPVLTDRTNAEKLRIDRLAQIALEAAEQCGRMTIPAIDPPRRLAEVLLKWEKSRPILYCDEAGDNPEEEWGGPNGRAAPLMEVVAGGDFEKSAILVGPEGGFSPDERAWLRALPYVRAVTLGPRILRADTAAIVSLALWQAAAGDLRRS